MKCSLIIVIFKKLSSDILREPCYKKMISIIFMASIILGKKLPPKEGNIGANPIQETKRWGK